MPNINQTPVYAIQDLERRLRCLMRDSQTRLGPIEGQLIVASLIAALRRENELRRDLDGTVRALNEARNATAAAGMLHLQLTRDEADALSGLLTHMLDDLGNIDYDDENSERILTLLEGIRTKLNAPL